MGKSSPSMPAPPDPQQVAAAQGAANIEAARATAALNRYDTVTPYGSQTWSQSYGPQDQAALDQWQRDLDYYNGTTLPAWTQAQQAVRPQPPGNGQYIGNSDQGWSYANGGTAMPGNPMPQAPARPDVHAEQWTQRMQFSPAQQANFDLQTGLTGQSLAFANDQLGRVAQTLSQPFAFTGMPAQVSGIGQTVGAGTERQDWRSGDQLIATTGNSNLYAARQPQPDAQARFQALGAELQGADPQQAAQAQQQFFSGLAAGDIGGIVRNNPALGAMALGNAGQRLATLYGPGQGDAVARWSAGVQQLMANGMDVGSAHSQVLSQMSGGDLAAILQNPGAASYGAAARGAIAQRADQLAAAKDRPDQGAGAVQRQLDTGGLQALPSIYAQGSADPYGMDLSRQAVEDALYRRTTARLDPQWQQQEQALASQLANQGIPIGSAAYNAEMDRFARARTDAYAAAMNDAVLAGGNEQSRLYGLGLAGRQQGFDESLAGGQFANASQNQAYAQASNTRAQLFGEGMASRQQGFSEDLQAGQQDFYQRQANAQLQNQARQQAIQEELLRRNQPINELVALLGTSGGVQMPQFGQPSTIGIAPPDLQGSIWNSYDAAANAAGARAAASRAETQGLFNLLGTAGQIAAGAGWLSDRRLKRDIRLLGRRADGLGIYAFRYLWRPERFVGAMADEVRQVAPWAVYRIAGFDAVDYAALAV